MTGIGNGMNTRGFRIRPTSRPTRFGSLRILGLAIMWLALALLTLWAVAALYVDFRIAALRIPVTVIYVLAVITVLLKVKRQPWSAAFCFAAFCVVLTWWLTLKPSNDGDWQADTARTAWVEIDGDRVTIHNLHNCD